MSHILNGKALAARIQKKIQARVQTMPSTPGLAILLVGDDPASHIYVQLKRKACEEVGIHFELFLYPATEPEQTLINNIQELNRRNDIHGILVQLPLPSQNANNVIFAINPLKDVDGFHPANLEKLRAHQPSLISAVALGVMRLIREAVGTGPLPPHATIVSSPLFAEPLEILLKESGVQTTVTQAEDKHLADKTTQADLLIVAEGIPGLITKDFVKPDAILIDVGTTRTPEGLVGDVDLESVKDIISAITPVPGGVGPMTVAMLLVNILKAYELQKIKTR
ncbi:bifunctional 5,10-methylenetetrahydrofolate dehydrogenase/5,10-methenyltetrahydrofolate cyclohydrolase [Candidatus Uhrbacteria bacterium]|nr:bifunctional 5,10-methylenetetrahydrofolate dehydrogenase/5,10-methenyltetrahydrofolate cyclohydrolase [Candidatus Uhrbacteria bacterium]